MVFFYSSKKKAVLTQHTGPMDEKDVEIFETFIKENQSGKPITNVENLKEESEINKLKLIIYQGLKELKRGK